MIIHGNEVSGNLAERMAAYEDSGLDPEQVKALIERAAKLEAIADEFNSILQLPNCNDCAGCQYRPPIGGALVLNCPFHKPIERRMINAGTSDLP